MSHFESLILEFKKRVDADTTKCSKTITKDIKSEKGLS